MRPRLRVCLCQCLRLMQDGEASFFICHRGMTSAPALPEKQFRAHPVGADRLVPLCAPDADGQPRWRLECRSIRALHQLKRWRLLCRAEGRTPGEPPGRAEVMDVCLGNWRSRLGEPKFASATTAL